MNGAVRPASHQTWAPCLRLVAALLGLCAGSETLQAQQVRGVVAAPAQQDGAPRVFAAEITVLRTGVRTRTGDAGQFRIAALAGDTLRVRALGFREQRLVIGARDTTLRVELLPVPTLLDRVVTTVGQREIRAGETPASVTVLSKEEIAAAAAVSANQLLRRIPGLQELASPPAQTSIAIRGLDQSRVLVLIDGEPVAGAMTENRDIGRLSTLAAERIEVVKGPSSVEYGSEALGGVINLVTAAPTRTLTGTLIARSGQLGRRESSAEVSHTLGAVGFRMSGGWRQSDRVTAINASGSTLDRVYDFRGDTRILLSDRVTVRTDLTLSQQRQRWPVGAGFNGFIDNRTAQGFAETQVRTGGGTLRARVFGQQYAYQFREALGALPIAGSADSLEQQERLSRVLLAYARGIAGHAVDLGAQYSNRSIVAPTKIDGDRASDQVIELFARDAWRIGPVQVTAGARSTSSTLWGNAVSPSLGAVWEASPSWRWRTNIARGFRAPAFKEMRYTFINGAAGYQIIGNDSLRPESSWSGSIGGRWAPTSAIAVDVDAYRNDLSNLIAIRNIGTNAAGLLVYRNINVARARTAGMETNVQVTLPVGEVSIGYDYLRAEDLETGATLEGRARHTARLTFARSWAVLRGLTGDLSARYTGEAPRGAETQRAFASLDGQVRLNVRRDLEVSMSVVNLLDQRPALWTPAFQRQVTLGIRAGFTGR